MGQIDKDLLDASINGDLEKAIWAIEKGADVDAKHNEGNTPLHWKGQTPLCLASWKRHDSIVSLLLENGANVNVKDEDGCTPLHFASMEGQDAVVSLLLENGADVNAKNDYGNTPLHKAGYNGHEAVVSLLLEKGADRNITNYYGKTPLQIAQKYKKQNCVAAIEQFQPRFFYRHLDEISTLVQHATENEFVSLVPIFEKALNELSDFLQLKYYFTAVNAQYRLGTITTEDRNRLILASLEKAKVWCVSPFYVAMYRVALRYSLSEKIITQFQLDQLDVASLECDVAHTDYIQAMQMIIPQNSARINRLENSLAMFQQAVVTSVCELQHNVIAVNKNVQNMHRDMHGMAVAINDTQAALKKFKASLEFKRKVEAGCSLVSAVLNAVSLGSAGSALQGVLVLTLASTADFGDLAHVSGVLNEAATTIGDVSIHNMLNTGIMLAEGYATQRLEDALRNENAIVVIAASAAVFSKALDLDTTSDELVAKPSNEEPPVFDKQSKDPPIADEPSKGYYLNDVPSAPALPASSSDDDERKIAGLEKKRERLICRAKLAKELDKEVDSIYQQIQLLDEEIEELHDRIDNIRI